MSLFTDKTILVCGALGVSGRAAAALAFEHGATVVLSDKKPGPLPADLQALKDAAPERLIDARPREDAGLLTEIPCDFVITAPGLPSSVPVLQEARRKGLPVRGENDTAYYVIQNVWKTKPFYIAVTGTDGKSTTTGMIAHILNRTFGMRALPCGNYGVALSEIARIRDSADVLVVECSSFQLETVETFHPQVSMILNLSEDHLDRYADMQEYLAAKLHILDQQTEDDLFLAPAPLLMEAQRYVGRRSTDGTGDGAPGSGGRRGPRLKMVDNVPGSGPFQVDHLELPENALMLPGRHNRINLSFALAAIGDFASRTGHELQRDALIAAVQSYRGLPHRLERVCTDGIIEFVNDSKATTVQAVAAAVVGFPGRRIMLLCGGKYKGGDFGRLSGPDRVIFAYGAARDT
ncbi:MAG: UDP-N-acetylmuramoyl-L-alanine--D-glutamate ligase, partial [Spirochaetia bacterium]|nr:UDP-N-acetylmuramoyl-L-alanine--D-glutamate ligase [Spirochaetia bacterium]